MRLEKETAIYQLGAIAADIDGATTLAKGKNKIFYQDTAPASGMNEGDLWFKVDSSGGSSLYEYKKTGSNPDTYAWTLRQLGQGSLVAGSVTANEINVNNLSAISANLGSVDVGGANNQDGVITVLDASGNPIGYWNNAGIDAQGTFKATNGNESCVMDSDTQGAYVSAENSVSGIRMSANHDGSVGLYEVTPLSGGGESIEVLWERTGTALNTEKSVTVGYLTSAPNNGVTIGTNGDISASGTGTFSNGLTGYNNTTGQPVVSIGVNTAKCSMLSASGASTLQVTGQWNSSTYSVQNITVSSSDVRLKKNIKDSTVEALPLVNSIKIREFDWKQDDNHQAIGMVADELEELDENLSVGGGTNEDGTMNVKSVDTFFLVGYLTKAVQELSAKVEQLEARVKELEEGK